MRTMNAQTAKPRIALTGASGFIGGRILSLLLDNGFAVSALENKSKLPPRDNLSSIHGALDDPSALDTLVQRADSVIHCAGLVATRRAEDFFLVNQGGTENIVSAAEKAGVKRILLLSSLAARMPNLSPYAASKHAGEISLQDNIKMMAWDILRPPAVYGPGDRQILRIIRLLRAGIGLVPAGPDARVSLIHVDDLAQAVLFWLQSQDMGSRRIYEIDDGTPNGYTWRDILTQAGTYMNKKPVFIKPPVIILQSAAAIMRAGGDSFMGAGKIRELTHPDWVCRDNLFQKETAWRPQVQLREGLKDFLGSYPVRRAV